MVLLCYEAPGGDGVTWLAEALIWQSITCKWLRLCYQVTKQMDRQKPKHRTISTFLSHISQLKSNTHTQELIEVVLPAHAQGPGPGLLSFLQVSTQQPYLGWLWPPATAAAGTALLQCCTAPGAGKEGAELRGLRPSRHLTQLTELSQETKTKHWNTTGIARAPVYSLLATGKALWPAQLKKLHNHSGKR